MVFRMLLLVLSDLSFIYSSLTVTGTWNIRDKFAAIGRQIGLNPVLVQLLCGVYEFIPMRHLQNWSLGRSSAVEWVLELQ